MHRPLTVGLIGLGYFPRSDRGPVIGACCLPVDSSRTNLLRKRSATAAPRASASAMAP
jgi:hypothetical protein